jgi:heat shock protein HslJ
MKTSAFVYLGLAWLLLPGCDVLSDAERSPLVGPPWVLQAIAPSGENQILVEDRSNYVIFQEDGAVEGRADCNTCQGEYTVEGDRLEVDLACTRIYCGEASKGDAFQRGLVHAVTYQVRGDRLTIATEKGTLFLKAVR